MNNIKDINKNPVKEPKFILVENLGKLAKILRFLGYDAVLHKKINFMTSIRIANKQRRIILTRSNKQAKLKNSFRRIMLKSDQPFEQLKELSHLCNIREEFLFSRCTMCNDKLQVIDKEEIKTSINKYVLENNDEFKICKSCGRIYWKGTHYTDILNSLQITI